MGRKGKVEELEKEKCREERKSKPLEVGKKKGAIKKFLLLCITQETYFSGLLEKQCHFWMAVMFYLSQPGVCTITPYSEKYHVRK